MDLLGTIAAAKELRDVARKFGRPRADWEVDEVSFERHFGVPFEAYLEVVQHLSQEQHQLLSKTLDVNPEAAVLWILAMEQVG